MANINKLIELTLKNGDAGPYFDVYYSTDCNSYTICIDGTNVYLPNLSSTAIVTVPDNTTCMKLINKSAGCSNNDYIQVFGTTTTTTTCAPCAAYNILGNSSPWTVTFRDCFGQVQTVGASSTVDRTFCAQEVISASNTAYESAGRNCINGPCSGTSASINICDCDIQRLEVEPGVGNVSLISYIPCAQSQSTYAEVSYYGTTYYDVCIASGSWVLDPNKGETSYRGECSDCATTTTTTAAPTTTTTTLGCASCRNITFDGNITHASLWGYWTSCDGTPNSVFVPADTTYGPVCVQNGSAYGQAYTNGACCDPTTTTTTTTTAAPTILDWSFSITGGPTATFDLYINASIVESRNFTSNGTYTVNVGDEIKVDISVSGCSGFDNYANAYSLGIIADAACGIGTTTLSSYQYQVQPGDVGTTLNLDTFASCDGGCV